MCNNKKKMRNFQKLECPKSVKVGNGESVEAKFKGSVKVVVRVRNKIIKLKLKNVLYVPELKYNLFSVSAAAKLGKKIQFDEKKCSVIDKKTGEVVATASKAGQLYYLDIEKDSERQEISSHRREMKKAFLSFQESNFKEEMMKRLNTIEEDKMKFNARMSAIEESSRNNNSYTFKEENCQNTREDTWDVMKFLQEDSEEEEEEDEEYDFHKICDSENLKCEIVDLVQIQEDNKRKGVDKSGDKIQEGGSGSKQELEEEKVFFKSRSSIMQSANARDSGKRFRFARKLFSNIIRKCSGVSKTK